MVVWTGVRLGVVGRFRDGLGRFGGAEQSSDVVGVGESGPAQGGEDPDSSALDG